MTSNPWALLASASLLGTAAYFYLKQFQPRSSPSPLHKISSAMSAATGVHRPSIHDVYHAAFLLRQLRLPGDLIPTVLDQAEYWHHIRAAESTQKMRVSERDAGRLYLAAPLPTHLAPNSLRKIAFTVTSNDQGYSWDRANHGTYAGSWTWFEVLVYEPDAYTLANILVEGRRIITNRHAIQHPYTHIVEWRWDDDSEEIRSTLRSLKSSQRIGITEWAKYPAWVNEVHSGNVEFDINPVRRM